jgi:hypothetical protein
MNAFSDLSGRAVRFVGNNSPVILTGVGVAGVLTTAFLTGKATIKATDILREEQTNYNGDEVLVLDTKEKFALVWKVYIPPVGAAVLTIVAIICANRIEYRRAAAVAAAYAISERSWQEYKDKIVKHLGPKKEQAARDEQAQDEVTKNPPTGQVLIVGNNDVLCLDRWSGRYFRSTMEKIKTAMVNVNFKVIRNDFASLSDFYDELRLEPTTESDNIGWNTDVPLDLDFSHALSPDNEPVLTFEFRAIPFRY